MIETLRPILKKKTLKIVGFEKNMSVPLLCFCPPYREIWKNIQKLRIWKKTWALHFLFDRHIMKFKKKYKKVAGLKKKNMSVTHQYEKTHTSIWKNITHDRNSHCTWPAHDRNTHKIICKFYPQYRCAMISVKSLQTQLRVSKNGLSAPLPLT